jgi:heptose-I-phosphate ethanolaminephosphotransferase
MLSRLAAAAVALPFILALPNHHHPEAWARNALLWALIGAIFLGAEFAAQRVARLPHGERLVAAFAAMHLVLGGLGFLSLEHYSFSPAVTDLALLCLIFFAAAAAARVAVLAGRALLAVLVLGVSLAAIVQAVHLHTFGFAIGPDGYRAILQSNPGEAIEFAGRFLGPSTIVAAVVSAVVAVAAALGALPVRVSGDALAWTGVYALAALAILSGNAPLVLTRAQGFAETIEYAAEIWEYRTVRATRQAQQPGFAVAQQAPLSGREQTYVFVVGESLTRNHMSLYGYWRQTTPELDRLAGEMAIFQDAVSPHSHTDHSLELVLTLAKQDNRLRFTDAANYSLIELLRAAGFATWWISNQNAFGPWDNKVSVLARGAERVHYAGARSGRMVIGAPDEVLLEPFAAALRDPAPRKAIFLHFLGNHWEYAKRYPPEAAVFNRLPTAAEIGALRDVHSRPDLINAYDNAVRYHDRLVAQIIEMLRATQQPAVLTLFADHGESVYQQKGHYWREFTHDHVEVPLALWFSPQYSSLAAETVARARANSGLPFALENLPHLVADLTGLRSPVFEPQRSPLSDAYRPGPRSLFEGSLVYEQADAPKLNARRALERIAASRPALRRSLWAHRVNTQGKMMEAAPIFAGVEIDVVYDPEARALMVNHPPDPPSGLALDTLLGQANRLNPQLALWLDLKNLHEANAARVLKELDRLDRRHSIRGRALVETSHTGPAAAALRAAGYLTSYYLPPALLTQDAGAGREFNCYGADDVRRALEARRFAAVSYDWRGRRWVEHCLGRFLHERGVLSYVWDLDLVISERRAYGLLDAERVQGYGAAVAVLVPFRSSFDDWR